MTENPLLSLSLDVPFDRIRPEHVRPAFDHLLAEARARIAEIGASHQRTYASTLGALEDATEDIERAMAVTSHLESAATTPELRAVYVEVRAEVAELFAKIPLDAALWRALRELAGTAEARALEPTRKRFLEKTIDEFRRHGAELPEDGKRELAELDVELAKVTTRFGQNVLDATNAFDVIVEDPARLAGLSARAIESARESAAARGKPGWRFTLQGPSILAVLEHADDRALREQLWRAFNVRATEGGNDNRPLLSRILELRRRKAALLGYPTFVDLVLADRMAGTAARAQAFVRDLADRTRAAFERENVELRAFAGRELEPWDVGYWAEKQRRALYDFDEEQLRPYFAVDRVLEGMFETVQRLYGIRIAPREAPAWDPSVRAYSIHDGSDLLGAFYADLFPRENKRDGAWMKGLRTGSPTPHLGVISANVSPPVGGRPALLSHRDVETLFHEFGHLMHHCLSRVDVRSLAGANVAWDFVELPSQIMENWTWHPEGLALFATHWETGAPLPHDLLEKMRRARTYRAGNAQMRQLGFATMDLALHVDFDPERDGDPIAYARRIYSEFSPVPLPGDWAMPASFGHLFASPVGYAGGYYSYKWAEVLDADAFTLFAERPFDREAGMRFRRTILERGDSRDPAELFRELMGREPSLDPLLARSGLLAQPG